MQREQEQELLRRIGAYSAPSNWKAAAEISGTVALLLGLSGFMIWDIGAGYCFSLLLLPLAGVLVTRLFTIQHDCGHGSYFSSPKINNLVGNILGVVTFTPYHYWKKNHNVHHAFSGNLDKRGIGDMATLTVREYHSLPFLKKAWYRVYRSPAFILIVAPTLLFGVKHRLPLDNPFHSVKSWASVMLTNLGIGAAIAAIILAFGLKAFLLVYLPVTWLGCVFGVSGFYIQHQYEDAYWRKDSDWTYFDAGLHGSSYFEFPRVINWLVNNINLHHIHHLNGRIPSYRLRECLANVPELRAVRKRTLADVPACFTLALWDDERKKMVGF
jgi:omega-6 fatty acid desaturase (delta-12 desaturase)